MFFFFLLIEVSITFVIQGFALTFRSLTDIFCNGACSVMIELTKLAYIEYTKSAECFSVSDIKRSILKSLIITIALFSCERFSRRSVKYIH